MTIEDIKQRLEVKEEFKEYHEKIGLTFEDFKIIDIPNNKILQKGNKKIGDYCIMIRDNDRLLAHYALI